MTDNLDLHPASSEERIEAYRNVHDVWGGGLDLEAHLRRRSGNPKFNNATWYVGCLDGRVVTACGCYHVSVRIDGAVERACAIGSVHTLADFRGRGFAPRMLAFAESQEQAVGKTFSLLYSDISPGYYARLGYRLCPAAKGTINPDEATPAASAPCSLIRFQPGDELPALLDLYDRGHARHALSIARSPDYWRYLIVQDPQDEFYFADVGGRRAGYVRLGFRPSRVVIRDLSLIDESNEVEQGLYSAVIALCKARGAESVSGWMPSDAASRELFQVTDRAQELTMIKPLVARIQVEERHCQAAEHFHEIDHV
jgi:predicted acetyltransferase